MTFPSVFRIQRREAPAARFTPHPALPLVDEVNRLFEDFFTDYPAAATARPAFVPSLEIEERDKDVRICAELPGLDEKDFELSIDDGVLTLRGEKRSETSSEKGGWSRTERSYGRFERRVALPCEVVADKASADFKRGVLTVTLPKSEPKARAVAIPVKAE
jgi:HSP20 family protein